MSNDAYPSATLLFVRISYHWTSDGENMKCVTIYRCRVHCQGSHCQGCIVRAASLQGLSSQGASLGIASSQGVFHRVTGCVVIARFEFGKIMHRVRHQDDSDTMLRERERKEMLNHISYITEGRPHIYSITYWANIMCY